MFTRNRQDNDTKRFSPEQPDGYRETIRMGMQAARLSCRRRERDADAELERLRAAIRDADAVVIGAGAGLST